jgi:hypothetical protein
LIEFIEWFPDNESGRDDGTEVLYSLADPNWNVVALVADTGNVLERYRYDAYGERDVQTSAFATRS